MNSNEFIATLVQRNRHWARVRTLQDPLYFETLAQGQSPRVFWIGCADSRVDPGLITGAQPGEIFTLRNIANLVSPYDTGMMAALHYAVEVLQVPEIAVCGHHGCGGVKAALEPEVPFALRGWLAPLRDLAQSQQDELELFDGPERVNRLAELNAHFQLENLRRIPWVAQAESSGRLKLSALIYHLERGELAVLTPTDIQGISTVAP